MKKEKKPALSFRLGSVERKKLAEISEYQDESQVEVMRQMINVAHRAMNKRKKERQERRAEREAAHQNGSLSPGA